MNDHTHTCSDSLCDAVVEAPRRDIGSALRAGVYVSSGLAEPMPHVVLRRLASRPDGMFGALLVSRRSPENLLPFCLTLEDPWLNNLQGESCIPAALYLCERIQSPKFGNTFTVLNVPGRSLIRWHWGNTHRDTRGCILLAESFDTTWDDQTALLASKSAFGRFLVAMAGVTRFTLSVEDAWGGSTRIQPVLA